MNWVLFVTQEEGGYFSEQLFKKFKKAKIKIKLYENVL
jgi:hypothetical protein